MATSKMQWSDSDNKKLQNKQRQYNRRIAKINEKLPADMELDKLSIKELKAMITTRADFKTVMSYMEAALKPNATKMSKTWGVPIVVIEQTKRALTLANRENTRRREEVKALLIESGVDVSDDEMGHPEIKQYRERTLKKGKTPKEIVKFKRSITHQASKSYDNWRDEIYKENYKTVLFDPQRLHINDARKIWALIGGLDATYFFKNSMTDWHRTLEYVYFPSGDFEEKAKNIYDSWLAIIK